MAAGGAISISIREPHSWTGAPIRWTCAKRPTRRTRLRRWSTKQNRGGTINARYANGVHLVMRPAAGLGWERVPCDSRAKRAWSRPVTAGRSRSTRPRSVANCGYWQDGGLSAAPTCGISSTASSRAVAFFPFRRNAALTHRLPRGCAGLAVGPQAHVRPGVPRPSSATTRPTTSAAVRRANRGTCDVAHKSPTHPATEQGRPVMTPWKPHLRSGRRRLPSPSPHP